MLRILKEMEQRLSIIQATPFDGCTEFVNTDLYDIRVDLSTHEAALSSLFNNQTIGIIKIRLNVMDSKWTVRFPNDAVFETCDDQHFMINKLRKRPYVLSGPWLVQKVEQDANEVSKITFSISVNSLVFQRIATESRKRTWSEAN